VDARRAPIIDEAREIAPSAFATHTAWHAADVLVDLPLARMQPGTHLLSVIATDGQGEVRRHLQFTVR
jgi:hypothetical protein